MIDFDQVLGTPPFSLDRTAKAQLYREALSELTRMHHAACPDYGRILDALGFDARVDHDATDIPFLPVRLFKMHELASVPRDQVVKTLTSSGTSSQQVSKIFLDKVTAARQTKVLAKISGSVLGPKRLPMLIIDSKATVSDRARLSARGAGILGFSMLGSDPTYALDDDMNLDRAAVDAFLAKHADEPIFIFGFTFMIWKHFLQPLAGARLPIERGIVLHGGGWKKLAEEAVDDERFKACFHERCGVARVHNYYGMAEQTGSIFIECERGRLHCSIYSDLIMRRASDFSACAPGERGLIQLLSLLPSSYPGHSLLSEDLGEVTGEDDCPCGRLGKTFVIHGRVKAAELRGCSDTYATARESGARAREEILVGGGELDARPLPAYSPIAGDFLAALSHELIHDRTAAQHADVTSFAFWCRKASFERMKADFVAGAGTRTRVGLGVAFHITPSNVPVNFAFSFAFGLLAGNANRVRVPSKPFPQVEIICGAIARVLAEPRFAELARMTQFVRYEQDDAITGAYSASCSARIIWGGDVAIQNLRRLPIPERAVEVAFADRYSFCVLDAPAITALAPEGLARLAQDFYNDTYLMDQNACSSPHLIVWQGAGKAEAKQRFHGALAELVAKKYDLAQVSAVDKYTQLCDDAIGLRELGGITSHGNQVVRVALARLPDAPHDLRGKAGYFYELDADTLDDVARAVTSRYQTLTYFGVPRQQLLDFVVGNRLTGIDRIVPVGAALEIGVIWDGYDVIATLSRVIELR